MLDILELAVDPLIQRVNSKEQSSRETYYNAIMNRLRERNLINEAFIMKYIKKASKKIVKSKFTLPICQGIPENGAQVRTNLDKKAQPARRCHTNCSENIEQSPEKQSEGEQMVKVNALKATNDTINDKQSIHNLTHSGTLNLIEHVRQNNKKFSENQTKNTLCQGKCTNNFTKYLRNFFISRLTQNSRLKQKQLQKKLQTRKSYQGRIHTDIQAELKQKLKVKSLVFGHFQVTCAREVINNIEISSKTRLHTESYGEFKNNQRYSKKFQQDHNQSKGILPTIHKSLAARNKRCLENYIRFHQDKTLKEKSQDFRTVKLPTQAGLVYNQSSSSNRKAGMNKLSALHVRKM